MQRVRDTKDPHKTLLKGIEQLGDYHWFVSAGTALGLYRDGDLIPGDTDIDVEILLDKDIDFESLEGFKQRQFIFNKGKMVQRAFTDPENGFTFDIYFYFREGDIARSYYDHGQLSMPIELYENRKQLDTKYGKLYFPHPIEDYLEKRYGDWKIPSNSKGVFG